MVSLPNEALLELMPSLKKWYQNTARPLPWRKPIPNPYEVWMSEVMSQQSTMKSVIPYFERWMRQFPTLDSLANSTEQKVLEVWQGLGYYSRARNVFACAKELVVFKGQHGGWPQLASEWIQFKGIGPYTANAIASICFKDKVLPVDGNVYRVFSRLLNVRDPLNNLEQKKIIEDYVQSLAANLPQEDMPIFAQAFMELGSQVCRPHSQVECELCPLQSICLAKRNEEAHKLPFKKLRAKTIKLDTLALIYRNSQNSILFRKIPEGQRLAGQWELSLLHFIAHIFFRIKGVTFG